MKINKVFICFVALVISACDGTLFSGGSAPTKTFDVVAHPHRPLIGFNYGPSQTYRPHGYTVVNRHAIQKPAPQVIKIILDQSEVHINDAAAVHGYKEHGSYASAPYAQYYKIIDHGAPISQSYAGNTAYGYASRSNHASKQFYALLPQILQIILEQDGVAGVGRSSTHYRQLVDAYGLSGKAIITRNEGAPSADLHGGHVVERGLLEVKSVESARAAPHPHPHYQTHLQHHQIHPASVNVGW